jgi:CRISPR system Cascade subunit CasD
MVKDFHTAHTFDGKTAFISNRYYLSDAVFVAALEGDDALIANIEAALANPVYPLSLGRRACPPSDRLVLGVFEKTALEALCEEPWQASEWYRRKQPETVYLEIVRDADISEPETYEKRDMPLTFSQKYRKYTYRSVKSDIEAAKLHNEFAPPSHREGQRRADDRSRVDDPRGAHIPMPTDHDAFNELEE